MAIHRKRYGFTRVDLLVVVLVIVILGSFAFMFTGCGRMHVTANVCASRPKQIMLALTNYETTNKEYPFASDYDDGDPETQLGILDIGPGQSKGEASAGYSWLVHVLPQMEQDQLYKEINKASVRFKKGAFHPELIHPSKSVHMSAIPLRQLMCPSFGGEMIIGEYAEDDYHSDQAFNVIPAITNYKALCGTHIDDTGKVVENGILVSKESRGGKAVKFKSIRDGLNNTICLVESREQNYASWYDGATAWTITTPSALGGKVGTWVNEDNQMTECLDIDASVPSSINYGSEDGKDGRAYLRRSDGWKGKHDCLWGPSSDHPGDRVQVCFAGVTLKMISTDIEPRIFLWLTTRAGQENKPKPDEIK